MDDHAARMRHLEALVGATDKIVSRAYYQTQMIKRMLDQLRSVDYQGRGSDILEGTHGIIARAYKTLGKLIDETRSDTKGEHQQQSDILF